MLDFCRWPASLRWALAIALGGIIWFAYSCGREPRAYSMVREISARIPKVADTEEIQTWLKHELALHSAGVSNRPVTLEIQELPGWLYDLDVLLTPRVDLV